MPILRLRKHQANFSEEDILINPADLPGLKLKDVVELRPPKESASRDALTEITAHDGNRILLQVRKWPEANQSYPNCVSIKDSIINTHLKLYGDVLVNIVSKKEVSVDSIEICFSNAYLARSYMWGLRNYLSNRCVYQRQKLDYLNIRSQICEIWANGIKVTSGYADDDTKIVFRSASSLVYLFIQMSSEMWDYDINGDLYCEKAINGFLTDLFETWRQNDCSHDITIVLFSRTFYDAESLDEFPQEMRECLQVDYLGRFYEDCYRVAFQNDRFDLHDWNAKLTILKSLFNQYQKEVINRHQEKYMTKIPRAYNSSAAQGNFLEVLNMSLNVFEKHYFDRSFDRTGQLSVVVSPGVGVFEVDLDLTNLTKQRIIDNGIGSDLVCLGEQPLHTVPLLKFNSKASQFDDIMATRDVYNIPHWINLSFYSSQNQVFYSNFVPRIKLPSLSTATIHSIGSGRQHNSNETNKKNFSGDSDGAELQKSHESDNLEANMNSSRNNSANQPQHQYLSNEKRTSQICSSQLTHHQSTAIPDLMDYDGYDAKVFRANLSSQTSYFNQQQQQQLQAARNDRSILSDMDSSINVYMSDADDDSDFTDKTQRNKTAILQRCLSDSKQRQDYNSAASRQSSDNLPIASRSRPQLSSSTQQAQSTLSRISLVESYIGNVKKKPESADDLSIRGYNVQSSRLTRSTVRPKALINPFDPSHMTIKLTPNRRRWTHVFPQGPTGTFIQQHHYQPTVQQKSSLPYLADVPPTIHENELLGSAKSLTRNTFDPVGQQQQAQPQRQQVQSEPSSRSSSAGLARRSPTQNVSGALPGTLGRRNPGGPLLSLKQSNAASRNLNGNNKSTLVSNDTIRFAWCASGEQEWTPAITTGVDWKSLTMPACLPLTTDFFPSKTSLQNDYVISEYNIDSSFIHSRYTLIEVYRELVCQRLQKGFQIILLPGQTIITTTTSSAVVSNSSLSNHSSSVHKQRHSSGSRSSHHRNSRSSTSSLSSPHNQGMNSNQELEVERERTEYTMSIGRIFHKLALTGNTITVTHYRPRHPYPTIKIDYCYRFRAPFHETYGQSWVHFKSERLENYNWNYLDNYICARGESTFALRSSLRFWRLRILILPSKLSLRRKRDAMRSIDTSDVPGMSPERHDLYHQTYSDEERDTLMESFIKLLEIINKTRRASASRVSSGSSGFPSTSSSKSSGSSSSVAGLMNTSDHPAPITPQATLSTPARLSVSIEGGNISSVTNEPASSISNIKPAKAYKDSVDCDELHFESINMDIDSALRDARRAEWVHVQYHNFYDTYQAFELIIKWMVASGVGIAEMVQGWSRKVGSSSSVHVVPIPWEPFAMPHSGKADPLRCPLVIPLHLNCLPRYDSLDDNQVIKLQEKILRLFGFTRFHDLVSTDDIEHQYVHMSGFAFVALPNLINAQDETEADEKSKTGRSPTPIVSEGDNSQQPILVSNSTVSNKNKSNTLSQLPEALDITAPKDERQKNPRVAKPLGPSFKLVHQETISSPHEEYITRHIGGARQDKMNRLRGENEHIEFIWSWNYMLTKRWRSLATQDESYAVSLMQDFKEFCRNDGERLIEFWNEVKDTV